MNTKDHPLDYRAIAEACNYVGNGPVTTEMITKTISTLKEAVAIWQRAALEEGKCSEGLKDDLEKAKKYISAMEKLLDSVPHLIDEEVAGDYTPGKEPCHKMCPACQWEKLKSAAA